MAAPTFGTAGTFLNGATSTSAAVPVPSGVAADDIVLIHLHIGSATAPTVLPSGFAEVVPTGTQFTTGTVGGIRCYWKRATGADSGTYDFTFGSSVNKSGVATRYPGCIATGTPYDAGTGGPVVAVRSSAGSTTPAVSLTTLDVDRLIVWAGEAEGLGAWTPPTGYTERVDTTRDLSIATVAKATAGTTGSVTGTSTASAFQGAFLLALLPVPPAQTINASTVAAPAAPFQPALDQTSRIFPGTVAAPATPPQPLVVPGAVSIFPTTIAAPSLPAPKMQQVIRPDATLSAAQVHQPAIVAEARPRLRIDFWALNDDGSVLCPLPHPVSWDLSLITGEPGAVKIEYPTAGLNFDVLHARVNRDRDLRIRIRHNGRHSASFGALLHARDGDDVVEDGTVTFYGKFLTALLSEAPLPYNHADDKGEWTFVDGTAGSILGDVLDIVQSNGYLAGASWGFSDTFDSNGWTWTTQTSATFSPGRTVLQVAQQLRAWGMLEFEVVDNPTGVVFVRAYEPTRIGIDRTLTDPPTVLRRGRDLTESPRKTDVADAATSLLVAGKDGVYVEVNDPSAIAARGRKVGQYVSEGNLTTSGAATAYGTLELSRRTKGVDQITHNLVFDQDQPLPLRDMRPLDWVYSDLRDGQGVGTRERIAQITISQPAGRDHYEGGVVLRDLISTRDQAVQRRLDGLAGGQIVTGTSTAAPQVDDGKAPGQVEGVAVASGAYPATDGSGATLAAVTATWVELEDNFDGSPMLDFDYYEVQFRYTDPDLPTGWQTLPQARAESASWDGVVAGTAIKVRVRAIDRFCRVGAWSAEEDHTTDADATPPPVPSTPDVQSYLGILTIEWDGLGSAGEGQPLDFDRVDVHVSQTSGFTPTTATYIDSLRGAGTMPTTIGDYGQTWYAKLVSYDKSGNAAAASAQDSAVLVAAQDGDIGAVSIGKLTAGIMSALMTISGIIRTASSGARVELDTTGLRCYSSTGAVLFEFNIPSSALSLVGKLTSGAGVAAGRTIVVDPATPEVAFYPNATAQRIQIQALNDVTPDGTPSAPSFQMRTLNAAGATSGPIYYSWDDGVFVGNQQTAGTYYGARVFLYGPSNTDGAVLNYRDATRFSYVQVARSGAVNITADSADVVLDGTNVRSVPAMGSSAGFSMKAQNGATAGVRAYYRSSDNCLTFVDNQSGGTYMNLGGPTGAYKTFVIPHPLDDPNDPQRWLVHCTLESPEAGVEYRGVAEVAGGMAWVDLPDYYDALTVPGSGQVQVSVELPDEPVERVIEAPDLPRDAPAVDTREDPKPLPEFAFIPRVAASAPRQGRFRIVSDGPDGTRVAWVVRATRADVATLEVEPLRSSAPVRGDGPYTWIASSGTRD